MASALTPLANLTLASSASVITLSSINQSYQDLVLVFEGNNSSTGGNYEIGVSLQSATSYTVSMYNSGGSYSSEYRSGYSTAPVTRGVNLESPSYAKLGAVITIFNYSSSSLYKTGLARFYKGYQTYANGGSGISSFMYNKTSAVTEMSITINGDAFAVGTKVALYGVSA